MLADCSQETLDKITLLIDHMAQEFVVPFRNAAHRCVGLGLISAEQWQAIQDLAQQERVFRILSS